MWPEMIYDLNILIFLLFSDLLCSVEGVESSENPPIGLKGFITIRNNQQSFVFICPINIEESYKCNQTTIVQRLKAVWNIFILIFKPGKKYALLLYWAFLSVKQSKLDLMPQMLQNFKLPKVLPSYTWHSFPHTLVFHYWHQLISLFRYT